MATQPHPQPPKPNPPPPPEPKPEAAAIGAKPADPKDPQAVKFNPPTSAPPRWDEHPVEAKPAPYWEPKPAIDPLAEKAPQGAYADGMTIADEQRARSAWIEAHGLMAYDEAVDQRPAGEKPAFDKEARAFVSSGGQRQVQGVAPPTKRE